MQQQIQTVIGKNDEIIDKKPGGTFFFFDSVYII